jgi:histidinol phosphatase-like PHP family hydrolase
MGREIGYGIPATCDHPDCTKEIDRGLDFCCGGMHGGQGHYCEDAKVWVGCGRYFCHDHKDITLCDECRADLDKITPEEATYFEEKPS